MKKGLLIVLALSTGNAIGASRTVFIPRQITTDPTYELGLHNYQHYYTNSNKEARQGTRSYHCYKVNDDNVYGDFFSNIIYQKTTNEDDLAKYFLKNNKKCLTVRENGTGELGSLWFETIAASGSNYSSRLNVAPERDLIAWMPSFFSRYHDFWLSLVTAVVHAEHDLNLCEASIQNSGTVEGFETVTNYLKNTNPLYGPNYGRMDSVERSKWGLDDIQWKLGYNLYSHNDRHLGIYAVGTVPTGRSHTAIYAFEPVIGSQSGSVGAGINGDLTIYEDEDKDSALNFMLDFKYRYAFSHHEKRSFDLKNNGDWSRYLLIVPSTITLDARPAINYLTHDVKVSPGSTIDLWGAFHFEWKNFNFETGYSFWWRESENVELATVLDLTDKGILDMAGAIVGSATSSSNANITTSATGSNVAASDSSFVALTTSNLNLCSAAHPSASSSKVYGALSYNGDLGLVGAGFSYEFAHSRNAFEQWGVWVNSSLAY